jgi:hypothetical protein
VGELKGTKISSSSFFTNDHMHAANSSNHAHHGRGERKRREKRKREIGTLMLF